MTHDNRSTDTNKIGSGCYNAVVNMIGLWIVLGGAVAAAWYFHQFLP